MPDTPEQMQEKLDELGETIDAARRQAEQDDLLPDDKPEPLFHEWSHPPEYEPKPEDEEEEEEDGLA
ncbi:MAG TPA: hypothetical protein VH479_22595 [Acidimicrobiales bacterium]